MTDEEKLRLLLIHEREQAWTYIAQYKRMIKRISEKGPKSANDIAIVKSALTVMLGELCTREAEAEGILSL